MSRLSCALKSIGTLPIFGFVIEAALINAWLLYKASRELALLALEYTLFTFRKSVALAMVSQWEAMGCKNRTTTYSPTKAMQQTTAPARKHLRGINIQHGTRFTSLDGHISAFQQIPLKDGSNLKVRQMRCQQCKKRTSIWWCKECEQPLCQGACFQLFHTKAATPTPMKET